MAGETTKLHKTTPEANVARDRSWSQNNFLKVLVSSRNRPHFYLASTRSQVKRTQDFISRLVKTTTAFCFFYRGISHDTLIRGKWRRILIFFLWEYGSFRLVWGLPMVSIFPHLSCHAAWDSHSHWSQPLKVLVLSRPRPALVLVLVLARSQHPKVSVLSRSRYTFGLGWWLGLGLGGLDHNTARSRASHNHWNT